MEEYIIFKYGEILEYNDVFEKQVVELWNICNLTRPWNNPHLDIIRKIKDGKNLFLIVKKKDKIIATIMGGYDGHRGVINYLAVHPNYRKKRIAKTLVNLVEKELIKIGCPKINLLIREENLEVLEFYKKINYKLQKDIRVLGKRLIPDD